MRAQRATAVRTEPPRTDKPNNSQLAGEGAGALGDEGPTKSRWAKAVEEEEDSELEADFDRMNNAPMPSTSEGGAEGGPAKARPAWAAAVEEEEEEEERSKNLAKALDDAAYERELNRKELEEGGGFVGAGAEFPQPRGARDAPGVREFVGAGGEFPDATGKRFNRLSASGVMKRRRRTYRLRAGASRGAVRAIIRCRRGNLELRIRTYRLRAGASRGAGRTIPANLTTLAAIAVTLPAAWCLTPLLGDGRGGVGRGGEQRRGGGGRGGQACGAHARHQHARVLPPNRRVRAPQPHRRGRVRGGVPGARQAVRGRAGAEEGEDGKREGGIPPHLHPRDQRAAVLQPPQHRRREGGGCRQEPRPGVHGDGVHGARPEGPVRGDAAAIHPGGGEDVDDAALRGGGLPPRQLGPPPGPEDVEHPVQQQGRPEDLRLWAGPAVRLPLAPVHAHGGDAVVPRARAAAGHQAVLHGGGHLVPGVHHGGAAQQGAAAQRAHRDRAA
eukprot:1187666-Prorocentrum_minimum.AAC.1